MGRYTGNTCKLLTMLALTSTFFVVEIVVGYVTNSLALVGDSYHMLSDVAALLVGFASVRISKWPRDSQRNTFGWVRAEVLGALINSVFLLALCFTILIEALQRMAKDEHIHDPDLMLIVGGIGLAINLVGLFLLRGHHGHSHGGAGESHGVHESHTDNHASKDTKEDDTEELTSVQSSDVYVSKTTCANGTLPLVSQEELTQLQTDNSGEVRLGPVRSEGAESRPVLHSSAQLNMRGVFLHVLGDALGSVIVIISALFIKLRTEEWRYKVDPAMSIVLVIIIFNTTLPLLRKSAKILLQNVPRHIRVKRLQEKLLENVEGVLAVHEFHVWQLAGDRIIASAHIRCRNPRDYMCIAEKVTFFFHNEGIHSVTIQPEFVDNDDMDDKRLCLLDCPGSNCCKFRCCNELQLHRDNSIEDYSTYSKPKQLNPKTKHVAIDMVKLDSKSRPPATPNHYVEDPTASDTRKAKQNFDFSTAHSLSKTTSKSDTVLNMGNVY